MIEQNFPLTLLLTSKYRTGYKHLEQQEIIGNCTLLASGKAKSRDESRTQLHILQVELDDDYSNANNETISRAISDTLDSSCTCEHDCCACICESVLQSRPLKNGKWAIKLMTYYNV